VILIAMVKWLFNDAILHEDLRYTTFFLRSPRKAYVTMYSTPSLSDPQIPVSPKMLTSLQNRFIKKKKTPPNRNPRIHQNETKRLVQWDTELEYV